jgi:protein-tyrosine phosphatase
MDAALVDDSMETAREARIARRFVVEMSKTPGVLIPIASVPNLRDLGGWPVAGGGTVRHGVLYRSTELEHLSDADLPAFRELAITTVYDFRTEAERTREPDRVVAGVDYYVVDVLADESGAAPAQLMKALRDPAAAEQLLGDGRAVEMFEQGYRQMITLPSALAGYRRFFEGIARAEHRPALFHCTTGKDRTGWASAAVLMLLGVSDDDVMRDFMLTNDELLPSLKPVFAQFEHAGGRRELLEPVLGVRPEYLEAALDELRTNYGDIETYFTKGLGLGPDVHHALRDALIDV